MNKLAQLAIRLLLGILGDFAVAALTKLTSRPVTDRLGRIAEQHVRTLTHANTLTNDEKRAKAIAGVKHDAKVLGIEAKDWVVNTAVELAVGAVKARLNAAP